MGGAELVALLGKAGGFVQGALGQAHGQGSGAGPGVVQGLHGDDEAHALFAEQAVFGDAAILEDHLPGDRGPDAHLFLFFAEGDAGIVLFHHEGAGAPGAFVAVGEGDDRVEFGLAGVGDPLLGAVQDVMVAVFHRGGGDGAGVGAGLGFGQGRRRARASPRARGGR